MENNNASMDTAYVRENPTEPVRILVSTATHLVPGDDYNERIVFVRDVISKHHWNQKFDSDNDRFQVYNAVFGYDNRRCYFLLDHGQSPDGIDDIVPILRYWWTGNLLEPIHGALPSKIRKHLAKYPFTPPIRAQRTESPRQISATKLREMIRASLRCQRVPTNNDFKFLREHPEHKTWLKDNIEPRFWLKFMSLDAANQELQDRNTHGTADGISIVYQPEVEKENTNDRISFRGCQCPFCSANVD